MHPPFFLRNFLTSSLVGCFWNSRLCCLQKWADKRLGLAFSGDIRWLLYSLLKNAVCRQGKNWLRQKSHVLKSLRRQQQLIIYFCGIVGKQKSRIYLVTLTIFSSSTLQNIWSTPDLRLAPCERHVTTRQSALCFFCLTQKVRIMMWQYCVVVKFAVFWRLFLHDSSGFFEVLHANRFSTLCLNFEVRRRVISLGVSARFRSTLWNSSMFKAATKRKNLGQ